MGDFFDSLQNETLGLFRNKKNLVNLLILGILILALPLGIKLIREQQILKSRALVDPIVFTGPNVFQKADGSWVTTKAQISLELTSPLGPPGAVSQVIGSVNPLMDLLMDLLSKWSVSTVYAQTCPAPSTYTQCGSEIAAGACVGAPFPAKDTIEVTRSYTVIDGNCEPVYACKDLGALPGQCGNPSTGQCSGSISYPGGSTCTTTYGNHSLNVSWDVEDVYGGCNIYLRGGTRDEQINGTNNSGPCSGSKTITTFNGAPLTNDGVYELFVSNGVTNGNCYNVSKGKVTIPCGNCSATIEEARRQLIAAGGSYQAATCDEIKNKVCTDCTIFVPPNPIRDELCPGTCGGSPSPSVSPVATPTPVSGVTTVAFRVAETPTELDSAPWQNYTTEPMKVDFEFKDKTPGLKFVWVEFKDSNGKLERRNAQITLLGEGPQVLGCSLGFEGNSVVFNIAGKNFGTTKGTVTSGTGNLTIRDWKDNIVQAIFNNPPTGQTFPIVVTDANGQKAEGHCSAISQLALGAKVFCRRPQDHQTDNVAMVLAEASAGGNLTRQTVSIDKDGIVQGLTQRLEEGKGYNLSLKAPLTLRSTTGIFTAQKGTTNIPNFILPVGDIFPIDSGDGTINSLDKGELNRQWVISVDATRTGDFNRDKRVNSIDWSCMRYDFGKVDDPEPKPGSQP